jgi:uncharacterized membrane protein
MLDFFGSYIWNIQFSCMLTIVAYEDIFGKRKPGFYGLLGVMYDFFIGVFIPVVCIGLLLWLIAHSGKHASRRRHQVRTASKEGKTRERPKPQIPEKERTPNLND